MTDKKTPEAAPENNDRPLDPEKLLRIASLVRGVLDEARQMDPDKTPNVELAQLHDRVMTQVGQAVPDELVNELKALDLGGSFQDGANSQEVRLAYSGLIGWLQGLFQGLQAAVQIQALTQELEEGETKEKQEHGGRYL